MSGLRGEESREELTSLRSRVWLEDSPHSEAGEPARQFLERPRRAAVDLDDALPPALPLVLILVLVHEPSKESRFVCELCSIPADRTQR